MQPPRPESSIRLGAIDEFSAIRPEQVAEFFDAITGEAVPNPEPEEEDGVTPEVPAETTDILGTLVSKPVRAKARNIGLAEKLKPLVSITHLKHTKDKEVLQRYIKDNEMNAASAENSAAEYTKRANNYTVRAKEQAAQLVELEKKVIPEVNTAPLVERLKRHKALQYVQVAATGALMLYYKPIWTMAQIEEDSKERVRMFVGCFSVKLVPAERNHVEINNLTFPTLGHWSVSGSRPCWGNWDTTIKELWAAGRVYDIVTMLAAYLASNEDGAAYSRTYKFRDERVNRVVVTGDANTHVYHKGDIGIYYREAESHDTSGNVLLGLPIVLNDRECYGGRSCSWSFLVPVNCNDHYGTKTPGQDWNVQGRYVIPLTEKQQKEVQKVIDRVKLLSPSEQRSALREWAKPVHAAYTKGKKSPEEAKAALFTHLDAAESLEYARVAQPLVIDMSKV